MTRLTKRNLAKVCVGIGLTLVQPSCATLERVGEAYEQHPLVGSLIVGSLIFTGVALTAKGGSEPTQWDPRTPPETGLPSVPQCTAKPETCK